MRTPRLALLFSLAPEGQSYERHSVPGSGDIDRDGANRTGIQAAIASAEGQPDREQAIRERAYTIWEEGGPEGKHLHHWLRAEAEINSAND